MLFEINVPGPGIYDFEVQGKNAAGKVSFVFKKSK